MGRQLVLGSWTGTQPARRRHENDVAVAPCACWGPLALLLVRTRFLRCQNQGCDYTAPVFGSEEGQSQLA